MADTTPDPSQENPGDLRNQRDTLANENKSLKARLAALEQDEQLRDAGLGHLSKRQRRTVLREIAEDGAEFTPDTALEIAKELGYQTSPTPPTPTPTPDPTSTTNGAGGNGQEPDPDEGMTAFELIDRARRQSATTQQGGDFEQKMRAAKSKEELRDIIRTEGPRHGIIHEWDVP